MFVRGEHVTKRRRDWNQSRPGDSVDMLALGQGPQDLGVRTLIGDTLGCRGCMLLRHPHERTIFAEYGHDDVRGFWADVTCGGAVITRSRLRDVVPVTAPFLDRPAPRL